MSEKEKQLAKFNLCKSLIKLVSVEQATADLYQLYHRHPEMFDDENDLKITIEKALNEPDLIIKNPTPKNDKDFMAYKQLNEKKIADVGVRNDNDIGKIFHANKKNVEKFSKDIKEQMLVETPSAKAAPTRLDHCASELTNSPMCNKTLSTSDGNIIPQSQHSNTEIPDSAIARMKHKIEVAMKDITPKEQYKSTNKEKER